MIFLKYKMAFALHPLTIDIFIADINLHKTGELEIPQIPQGCHLSLLIRSHFNHITQVEQNPD
jgi:hypothetical protein